LAFNSAEPRAFKYGTPRENALALRTIIEVGKEIRISVHITKGVAGYDFTRLY
jgi:D-lactate dehydrogenase